MAAPPDLNKLTTNKDLNGKTYTPPPPPSTEGGWRAGLIRNNPSATVDPKQAGHDYGHSNFGGSGPYQPTPDGINQTRAKLIQSGYNVAATGPATERFHKAYNHWVATKGAGSKVWNANHIQVQHPAPAPGAHAHGPLHVDKKSPFVPAGNGEYIPNDNVPGAFQIPAGLQAMLDKEFTPYKGDMGQPTIVDPKKLAASQADLQYGGAIDQSRKDISDMQGAEPGAQRNITKYFAPVKAQAAANVTSDDAANAQNVAAQAQLSPGLLAALGLSGADAGSIAANSKAGTDFASNMATLNHSDDINAQSAADRAEQQAHTTEDSNATIGLSGARRQLIQQLAAKGNAQTVDESTNRQQNFVNRTQGIANTAAISNINSTRELTKANIIGAQIDNAAKIQNMGNVKQNADINLAGARAQQKAAAAARQQVLINSKRLTEAKNPIDPNKPTKIPFNMVQGGDREKIEAAMWTTTLSRLPPDKAEREGNNLITAYYGWNSTPNTRAFVKSIIQKHQWDPKDKKYKA